MADFLGVSNLMDADVVQRRVRQLGLCHRPADPAGSLGDFEIEATCGAVSSAGTVRLAIRPERVQLGDFGISGQNRLPAMVERLVFLGSATQIFVRLAPGRTSAGSGPQRRATGRLVTGHSRECPASFRRTRVS